MSWYIILFLCFSILGVFLSAVFFFKKRGDRWANRLFSVFIILFSFELILNCLKWSGHLYIGNTIHLTFSNFPLWIAYGPLIYIYIRRILKGSKLKLKDLFFLMPILVTVALISPFYILNASEKLTVFQQGSFYKVSWIDANYIWLEIIIMFFYGFLILNQFGLGKRPGFKENRWLTYLTGGYFGFVIAFFLYIFLVRFELMHPKYDYFVDIAIVFFISIVTFFVFFQPKIFEGKSIKEIIPFIKYKKTGLSDALAIELKNKLESIMKNERPYLNNELRLNDLASSLNLSRNHTSQIINQYFNLSFFDFVNKYRIEEAKKLLVNANDNSTVTQIAYDVGFNNRASFYKAFKKFEGLNPSQYLQPQHAS